MSNKDKHTDAVEKVYLAGVVSLSVGFGIACGFAVGFIVFGILCLAYVLCVGA